MVQIQNEMQKFEALYHIFISILKTQELRIDQKKHEIAIIKNKLKEEELEIDTLKLAHAQYKLQVDNFKQAIEMFKTGELTLPAEQMPVDDGVKADYFG